MRITSPAFEEDQKIPDTYTCNGDNINPPLLFVDVPQKAESLVLILEDPDAPIGTFTHWVVYNIDPKIKEVAEDSVPGTGAEALNGAGESGYTGPCPPTGSHRYIFKLYALDCFIDVPNPATRKDVEDAMENHIIDQAELTGTYSRIEV